MYQKTIFEINKYSYLLFWYISVKKHKDISKDIVSPIEGFFLQNCHMNTIILFWVSISWLADLNFIKIANFITDFIGIKWHKTGHPHLNCLFTFLNQWLGIKNSYGLLLSLTYSVFLTMKISNISGCFSSLRLFLC